MAASPTQSRVSGSRVNGERSSSGDHLHVRSTIDLAAGRRRGTCMLVCVYLDKRVRNASLAIYVLRHTSSLALAPTAHPPGFSNPSGGGCPPRTSDPSFRPPPTPRHVAPASTDRPFRSTISVGSCHHRTGLRTPPDDTAPINRDPVSSPADTFFRLATLVQLLESIS